MIDLDLQINSKGVMQALENVSRKSGVPINFVVNDQMRLWLQDLIVKGPPQKSKSKGGRISGPAGRKAVANDLNKIFAPATRVGQSEQIEYLGQPFNEYTTTKGAFYLVPQKYWEPGMSAGAMKKYHEGWRGKQDGRVKRKDRDSVSKRGRLTVVSKKHVKQVELNRYKKTVQARVGRLAASWLPALRVVASKARAKGRYPKWLDKSKGASGSVSSTMSTLGTGYVQATNNMPYAERKLRSLLSSTRKTRVKDMTEQLTKRTRKLAKQFNNGKMRAA